MRCKGARAGAPFYLTVWGQPKVGLPYETSGGPRLEIQGRGSLCLSGTDLVTGFMVRNRDSVEI